MKQFFKNFIIACKDILNAFSFKKHMKLLEAMEEEEFVKLDLHTNWLGNVVYTQINFTEKDLIDVDYSVHDMVMKGMNPYIDYFKKMGWAEYLIPQVSNLQEEDEMTLSYLYLFVFVPKVFTFWKLFKLLFSVAALTSGIWLLVWYIGTYM